MNYKREFEHQNDVAAIITAMTDGEQPFLRDAVESVLSDPGIGQIVLCIEENNRWADKMLGACLSDPRLEIVRLRLAPLGAVRNQALKHVRLAWVAYCDGDDVWCRGKTLTQRSYASRTGCDFVGADHYLTDDQGRIRACSAARYLPMPSSWMVRTEVMQKHPFDESPFSLMKEESGEWWMRTAGLVSRTRCPNMLLRYRVRSGSLSSEAPSKRRKAQIVALASIPLLGQLIFVLTGSVWVLRRQEQYVWLKDWGELPQSSPEHPSEWVCRKS